MKTFKAFVKEGDDPMIKFRKRVDAKRLPTRSGSKGGNGGNGNGDGGDGDDE